jgi:hypothetical protein
MFNRYPLWMSFALVVGVAACSTAFAATVPLSDLLEEGASFVAGDKVFTDFTYMHTGDMPDATAVNVSDLEIDGDYGIRVQGGFVDQVGGSASDALITFNVTVAPESDLEISEVYLQANPAVFGGPGMASVTETLLPDIVNDKLVMWDFGDGNQQLADLIVLPQTYKTLSVQKDIILHATGEPGEGAVTLSFVDQTFKQIPEPSSLILVVLGLMAFVAFRPR